MSTSAPIVRTLIVKLASRCNLNCQYCYLYNHSDHSYLDRPRFMSADIFDATLDMALQAATTNDCGSVTLVMHGGEPTLLPVTVFENYLERAHSRLGSRLNRIALQTNGTLLSDAWIDCLLCFGVDVSVSIDGPAYIHDAVRLTRGGRGSHRSVVDSIRRLQERGVDVGSLSVITPGADGLQVFKHLLSLDLRRMNFLLPDVSHDDFDAWYGNFGDTPVADFLLPIFDAWFAMDKPEIVITVFWDIIERLLGGPGVTDMFGNPTLKYVAVETDGSVEALDALKVGRQGLADTGLNVQRDALSDLSGSATLAARSLTTGFPLSAVCRACTYANSCAGGYLPHRYAHRNGFDNPSVWCRDLKKLFAHVSAAADTASIGS
jgi:uncharacterized protein